jgi:DNA-binding CsgD family transcriptional regulator
MKKIYSPLLKMNLFSLHAVYSDAAGFIAATFLYFLSLVLYTWSTPAWFSSFPRASAFRFIFAVGVYCLCCMLFSGLRFSGIASGRQQVPFIRTFVLSFIPVPVFSVFVLVNGGLSLQHLQLVVRISDVYACAVLCIGVYTALKKMPEELKPVFPLRMLFLYGLIQTGAALFSLLPFAPGFVTAMCRITVLFLLFFYELFSQPLSSVQNAETSGMREEGDSSPVAAQYRLSPRETEVFDLVCRGRTNEEIAASLFISLSTVKTHLSSIFLKTGTRNRLEAAALCRKK